MATSNGQRVAAFFLAMLFLLSTIGATAYVVWQINQDEGVLVQETPEEAAAADAAAEAVASNKCGTATYTPVEPRTIPAVTKLTGAITTLKKVDIKEGTGEEVLPGDCVAALYYGTLASTGVKFDGNYETGATIEFPLTGVIPGWTEGIPGMKVGGVRRLEIPATQGYGAQGSGEVIPPNSDLIFEVEIVATRRNE